jgi:hypothetical protein
MHIIRSGPDAWTEDAYRAAISALYAASSYREAVGVLASAGELRRLEHIVSSAELDQRLREAAAVALSPLASSPQRERLIRSLAEQAFLADDESEIRSKVGLLKGLMARSGSETSAAPWRRIAGDFSNLAPAVDSPECTRQRSRSSRNCAPWLRTRSGTSRIPGRSAGPPAKPWSAWRPPGNEDAEQLPAS